MRKLEIKFKYKPTNISHIKEFEKHINLKLPNDYVEFLLEYNGGRFKEDAYEMLEPTHKKHGLFQGIDWFFTLTEDYNNNLLKNFKLYLNRMPEEFIPIGDDGCGNKICLCIDGKNYGKVYFWDHNWESDEGEEPTYDNLYLIANTFTEFVNKLYEYKLPEEQ